MTHDELVKRAVRWLHRNAVIPCSYDASRRTKMPCPVVVSEMSHGSEEPDALGWAISGRVSILVECKATRGDFLADSRKPARRRPELGVGMFRYYMAKPGILTPSDLPERWGLLEVLARGVRVMRIAEPFPQYNQIAELGLLWSALRRVRTNYHLERNVRIICGACEADAMEAEISA